jgi:ERCC4-related helicase
MENTQTNFGENYTPNNPKIITQAKEIQKQIFEKIDRENAVVFMETGKGKTFLSIMVIKSVYNEPLYINIENSSKQHRKVEKNSHRVVFLVCEVALVIQQSEVINLNTGLIVKTFRGGKMSNYNTYEKFREFWNSGEVFVSTPSILYKLLSVGYLRIEDIRLLVFDECHHCNQDHPYNLIMSEFYFYTKINKKNCKLPQILGLTASPLKKKIEGNSLKLQAKESLQELSENLDSRIIIDPDAKDLSYDIDENNIGRLTEQEAKREFYEYRHFTSNSNFSESVEILLNELLNKISDYIFESDLIKKSEYYCLKEENFNYLKEKFKAKNINDYNIATQKYNYLFQLKKCICYFGFLEKFSRHLFFLLENVNMEAVIIILNEYHTLFLDLSNNTEQEMTDEIKELRDENLEILTFTSRDYSFMSNTIKSFIDNYKSRLTYETDKLKLLKEKIKEIVQNDINDPNSDHRIIIFVENRVVSDLLNKEINRFLETTFSDKTNKHGYNFKSVSIVGVSSDKGGKGKAIKIKNNEREMSEKIQQFSKGEAQIMVATNTVEEGLDIKNCDHVIVYGTLRTVKSYIQMKGRARAKNALFAIFTENKETTIKDIQDFVKLIIYMRSEFSEDIRKDFRKNDLLERKKIKYPLYDLSTGAKISIKNSRALFNEILIEIKKVVTDIDFKLRFTEEPVYIGNDKRINFICVMHTTSESIDDDMKELKSEKFTDKDSATAHCYLLFLKKLHENEVIDDYLKFNLNN